MWQARVDKDDGDLAGKFLAVLPARPNIVASEGFFTRTPRRQGAAAVAQLAHRVLR